ncbi:hypothetical protein GNF98_15700 [Clostridium perfringens]
MPIASSKTLLQTKELLATQLEYYVIRIYTDSFVSLSLSILSIKYLKQRYPIPTYVRNGVRANLNDVPNNPAVIHPEHNK